MWRRRKKRGKSMEEKQAFIEPVVEVVELREVVTCADDCPNELPEIPA